MKDAFIMIPLLTEMFYSKDTRNPPDNMYLTFRIWYKILKMLLRIVQVLFVLLVEKRKNGRTHDLFVIGGKFSYPVMEESEWILSFSLT